MADGLKYDNDGNDRGLSKALHVECTRNGAVSRALKETLGLPECLQAQSTIFYVRLLKPYFTVYCVKYREATRYTATGYTLNFTTSDKHVEYYFTLVLVGFRDKK